VPQAPQNFAVGGNSALHDGHFIVSLFSVDDLERACLALACGSTRYYVGAVKSNAPTTFGCRSRISRAHRFHEGHQPWLLRIPKSVHSRKADENRLLCCNAVGYDLKVASGWDCANRQAPRLRERSRTIMKHVLTKRLIAPLVLLAFSVIALAQPQLPEPQGMLSDFAGKIDARTREQLEQLLQRFKDQTRIEVAVVTVNFDDMQGYPIEQYALELGRKWGVGGDSDKRALLLVVAIKPRGADGLYHGGTRLEVSRRLEGDVPDILAGEVIRKMRGDFQAGRFDEALMSGTQTILATLQERVGISVTGVDRSQDASRRLRTRPRGQPVGTSGLLGFLVIVIVVGIVVAIIVAITSGRGGGPGSGGPRRGRWGGADWIIWPIIFGNLGGGRRGSGWGGGWGSGWGGGGSSWGGGGGGGFGGFGGGGDFGGGGASDSW
jgi:uncharacterized protein